MSRKHWESQASNWAAWARTPHFDEYWRYSPFFFDLVPPPRGRTLEVGCGEGRVTRDLVARGHQVVGVDATAGLLRLAREADAVSLYVRCDSAALPFADASFDLVVLYNVLMDVDDMEGSVREAARVLRTQGTLCACVTHPTADSGHFESGATETPFVIEGSYLGPRRWLEFPTTVERGGLQMNFSGWAYPLEAYFAAMERAGLMTQAIREPAPDDADPRWRRVPMFLMWRALKGA